MANAELTCKELVELVTDYLENRLALPERLRFEEHLALCAGCQGLRQAGQLPLELLVQQWTYARSGAAALETEAAEGLLVQLDCLGCGAVMSSFAQISPGAEPLILPEARRLPDGSISTACSTCQRTNVLERRNGQLIAVRLW